MLKTASAVTEAAFKAKPILIELTYYDTPAHNKLTAEAGITEAVQQAKCLSDEIELLRAAVEGEPDEWPHTTSALRRMVADIRSPYFPRAKFKRFYWSKWMTDAATGELAAAAKGPVHLWAVAWMVAADKYLEDFGEVENWDEHQARLVALRQEFDALCTTIETQRTPADEQYLATSTMLAKEGYQRIGYRLSNGEVAIGPGSGKVLVQWLIDHPEVKP